LGYEPGIFCSVGGRNDHYAKPLEASFLKVSLRLRGELAPMQRWRLAQLAPTRELAPTEVLKNCPQGIATKMFFFTILKYFLGRLYLWFSGNIFKAFFY
jgi:hypothetical protein